MWERLQPRSCSRPAFVCCGLHYTTGFYMRRLTLIVFLMSTLFSQLVLPDAIVRTQAMLATTIAEFYVEEDGVMLNFGSAIMGPEVYLKALAMARNVARQHGLEIRNFTTAVFDLVPIEGDYRKELPKTDPGYYFRPQKTILVRTVADGGKSFYIRGDHRATIPALRRALAEE